VAKDAYDKAWTERNKVSDEGLALLGLALNSGNDARWTEAADLLRKKAKETGADAHWEGSFDGMLEYWADTSNETTALALRLLLKQDKTNGLVIKAARWLGQHREGGYWYNTKQTAMVIGGLTDYMTASGELKNASDVEVLVNGASVGKRHFGGGDDRWQITIPAAQAGSGGQVTIRKSGDGMTYWSAENTWYSTDKKNYQKGDVSLNIARDYFLLTKKQDKPTDPITYDLAPLSGPVHVGDILAVRLNTSSSDWRYTIAEDPIPAGTEFLANPGLYTLNDKPDWWNVWSLRTEFHDDRAAFFDYQLNGQKRHIYLLKVVNPGKFAVSPGSVGPMYQPEKQATSDPAMLEVLP
jgi:hypothetical protein